MLPSMTFARPDRCNTLSAMDDERFWEIVETVRDEVEIGGWSADLDQRWARALRTELLTLPPDSILDFDRRLAALRRSAETPEMAAAFELLLPISLLDGHGGYFNGPTRTFRSFVNCLVMLGRDTFQRALDDPDTLADHPLVVAVGSDEIDGRVLLASRVDDAAGDAYCESTGYDDDDYPDLVEPPTDETTDELEEEDESEDDEEYDLEDDEAALAEWSADELPRLFALYTAREQRADEELADVAASKALWVLGARLLILVALGVAVVAVARWLGWG